jgi:hypothetical protein
MHTVNVPFLAGQVVGIHWFTGRGYINCVKTYADGTSTYEVFNANDHDELIGYFEAHELYNIED